MRNENIIYLIAYIFEHYFHFDDGLMNSVNLINYERYPYTYTVRERGLV